ncbi:MAG: hypothetical protein NZ578_15350, partial [Candidatus Binatia bacterium]|nr:hypothetical protein [Candidatus Binatia bacterium]
GFPPGYITPRSYQNVVGSFTRKHYLGTQNTWEDLLAGRFVLVGSPATVREQLLSIVKELGIGILLCLLQVGSLPHELAQKNMSLFATEVMPQVRAELARTTVQERSRTTPSSNPSEIRV